ncbi:cytochrome P450 [Fonsecaea pedrosoi]|nr:cytochrome P450 [Fonsecaea pedrosoi]
MALPEQILEFLQHSWTVLLLGFLIARLLINKYGGNLNSIPGPFIAGFSNLWRVLNTLLSNPAETQISLHRKHNSRFVRIGPRVVSISDPNLIPTIYGIKSDFKKTKFYSIAELWYEGRCTPGLFESRDEAYHAQIRKPIVNAYSLSTILEFEPAVNSTVALLISKLDQLAASGRPLNLGLWLYRFAFDVIGEILFSKKIGFLESEVDVESIMIGIRGFTKYFQLAGQIPIVDRFLLKNPLMLKYGPTNPIVTFTLNRISDRVACRTNEGQRERDFLERCFEAQAKYPEAVTDRMIMLYNFDNIAAGSDTTALALTAVMYYLLKNPETLQKAVEELDCAGKECRLSEYITWNEASKLPYLQACIKEAIRKSHFS